MNDTVKLTKVVVQMGDVEQTLTVAQARQLRDQLNSLFGQTERVVEKHYHDWPYYRPWRQYEPAQPYEPYTVTWMSGDTARLTIDVQ